MQYIYNIYGRNIFFEYELSKDRRKLPLRFRFKVSSGSETAGSGKTGVEVEDTAALSKQVRSILNILIILCTSFQMGKFCLNNSSLFARHSSEPMNIFLNGGTATSACTTLFLKQRFLGFSIPLGDEGQDEEKQTEKEERKEREEDKEKKYLAAYRPPTMGEANTPLLFAEFSHRTDRYASDDIAGCASAIAGCVSDPPADTSSDSKLHGISPMMMLSASTSVSICPVGRASAIAGCVSVCPVLTNMAQLLAMLGIGGGGGAGQEEEEEQEEEGGTGGVVTVPTTEDTTSAACAAVAVSLGI